MEKFNEAAMKELSGLVIVDVAVEYLTKRRKLEHLEKLDDLEQLEKKYEKYFRSKHAKALANVDPIWFFEQIRKGYTYMKETGTLDKIDDLRRMVKTWNQNREESEPT